MAKRFTDTELWDKEWFMNLTLKEKLLVKYIREKADIAGIWSPNYTLASVYIGEKVTEDEVLKIDNGNQFIKLENDRIYCDGFIEFQYGRLLNPVSPVHRKIIQILQENNINYQTK